MFAVLIVISINEGCQGKRWLLLFGGILMGISPFLRIPNLSFLALLVVPFFYWYFNRQTIKLKTPFIHTIVIGVGFILGLAMAWQWMCAIGADTLIKDFIYSIEGQLEGESSHNSGSMLSRYALNYAKSLLYFAFFLCCIFCLSFTWQRKRWITLVVCTIVFILLHQYIYIKTPLLGDNFLYVFNGIALFGAFYYCIRYQKGKSEMALSATAISVLLPLGSDLGFLTIWVGPTLALPVGLCAMWEWLNGIDTSRYYSFNLVYDTYSKGERTNKQILLKSPLLKSPHMAFLFCVLILLVDTVIKIDKKAYYDVGARIYKTSPINSPQAKGIYTHEYKAKVVNTTLAAMSHYVFSEDVILVYDFSPLIYYLTETKPWAGIAWPCVYYGKPYVQKFNVALQEADTLPVVVMQHFYSSNNWVKVNDYKGNLYIKKKSLENRDQAIMNQCVMTFLKNYHYHSVWSNGFYEILVPENKYIVHQDKLLQNSRNHYRPQYKNKQ